MEDDLDEEDVLIYHRNILEENVHPEPGLMNTVATLKDVEPHELDSLYEGIDGLVEHFFSNPPPEQARAELTFSFEGYRITLYQGGDAIFQRLASSDQDRE